MSEFQVCLPSNVPGNTKNTPGQYETTLAKTLHLGPGWEVGLIDVTFPHTWMNINKKYYLVIALKVSREEADTLGANLIGVKQNINMVIIQVFGRERMQTEANHTILMNKYITIPLHGEYDIKSLLEVIQNKVREIKHGLETTVFSYDYDKNRITISGNTRTFYIFSTIEESLLKLLGFGAQTSNNSADPAKVQLEWVKFENNTETQAQLACNIKPIKSIYCYTNITEFVMVGNTQSPLLGYFPVQTKLGETGYWNFNPPYYIPVKDSEIRAIEMQLCSDTGETLKFKSGDVICRLNFRRTGALRTII